MNHGPWVVVQTYAALYEAELAAGRLNSSRIPHRIDERGAIGLFGPGHAGTNVRGVALLVPSEQLESARIALDLDESAV